jgi:hypothetical protein
VALVEGLWRHAPQAKKKRVKNSSFSPCTTKRSATPPLYYQLWRAGPLASRAEREGVETGGISY